jgi:phage tail P2-like protein
MFKAISILPRNHTHLEGALEQSIRLGKPDVSMVQYLMNPERCPAHVLGWLAWAFSVDAWNPSWSEHVKRDVINNSIHIHRIKGTVGAVRRALATIGFNIDISEWFDYGGDPHTFRIDAYGDDIFAAGFSINAELYEMVVSLVENVKPVRSHFALRLGESFENQNHLRCGSKAAYIHRLDLNPAPRQHDTTGAAYLRLGTKIRCIGRHEHTPTPRFNNRGGEILARSGSRHRVTSRITHHFNVRKGAAYAI